MTVAAFDMDGTLTRKDTFLAFIQHTHRKIGFWTGFAILSPVIGLMKAGLLSNDRAKEIVFSYFYKGWTLSAFNTACRSFADQIDLLLNQVVIQKLNDHVVNGDEVVIVSASIENWINPWAARQGVRSVIGTRIEVKDQILTGRFKGKNCNGKEKVNRLQEVYPQRGAYRLVSYGDSAGDKELFAWSDKYTKV